MKPSRVKIWSKKFPLKNMLGLCYTFSLSLFLYIYISEPMNAQTPSGVHGGGAGSLNVLLLQIFHMFVACLSN